MNTLEARRRLLGRNVYKRATEGNPAIAQDSLARMYPGITMLGWTEQESTTGKNLSYLEIGAYSAINTDKVDSETRARIFEPLYPTGDIVISIAAGFQVYCRKFKENTFVHESGWKAGPVKISKEDTFDAITVVARKTDDSNWSSEDLSKTNFQIEYGTSATAYEPYTGGAPSPSPDYPQEIVSAGKYNEGTGKWEYGVKLTGANLFNPSSDQKGFYTGTVGNAVSFKTTAGYSWLLEFTEFATGQYTISLDTDVNTRWRYYITDDNDVVLALYEDSSPNSAHSYRAFDIPEGAKKFYFSILEIDSADGATIMLNPGSEPLPYVPYRTPQTVTLTADRPLSKWDKLEKRNGRWGWVYKSAEIESYTNESVPGEYYSTTGQLSVGAQVWYETATETFVPLTTTEQEAMEALHTYRPTTVLSNEQDCDMTLTYKSRKGIR